MLLPSADALAARIPDGALVAIPPDNSLPSVAIAKALVRRGARGLRLLGVPVSGFATDILIGAGCVAEVETSAVSLGEAGFAPRFSAALKEGRITVRDATCPAIHTMLQAAEKGVPFMPLRGLIGSDILANRQCLARPAARMRHHRACLPRRAGDRGARGRGQFPRG